MKQGSLAYTGFLLILALCIGGIGTRLKPVKDHFDKDWRDRKEGRMVKCGKRYRWRTILSMHRDKT